MWKYKIVPFSDRGHELYWNMSDNHDKPVLTVEKYCKLYELYLINIDKSITTVPFPDCGNYNKLGSPCFDHIPNPKHVFTWALYKNYEVNSDALESMIFNWIIINDFIRDEYNEIHPADILGVNWRKLVEKEIE